MIDIFNFLSDPANFFIWGIAGTILIFTGCIISSISYKGRNGESYNPVNHYISELGEKGISKRANAFNAGLIIGGILDTFFIIQLGRFIGTFPALLFIIAGVIGALACTSVGIFSMDNLVPHMIAAMIFLAITVAAVFVIFLAAIGSAVKKGQSMDFIHENRPAFSIYPLMEWVVMLSISIWILSVSIFVIKDKI
jgi:hypothetical protein